MRKSVGAPMSWGILLNRASILCLVGSLLIGEIEEWAKKRRDMGAEALGKVERVDFADARVVADDGTENALAALMTA